MKKFPSFHIQTDVANVKTTLCRRGGSNIRRSPVTRRNCQPWIMAHKQKPLAMTLIVVIACTSTLPSRGNIVEVTFESVLEGVAAYLTEEQVDKVNTILADNVCALCNVIACCMYGCHRDLFV